MVTEVLETMTKVLETLSKVLEMPMLETCFLSDVPVASDGWLSWLSVCETTLHSLTLLLACCCLANTNCVIVAIVTALIFIIVSLLHAFFLVALMHCWRLR